MLVFLATETSNTINEVALTGTNVANGFLIVKLRFTIWSLFLWWSDTFNLPEVQVLIFKKIIRFL